MGLKHEGHINFGKIKNFFRGLLANGVGHKQMYDESSLIKILSKNLFQECVILKPGETVLENLGDLDLYERSDPESKSLYIEAKKKFDKDL